jgi:hypothetical protein
VCLGCRSLLPSAYFLRHVFLCSVCIGQQRAACTWDRVRVQCLCIMPSLARIGMLLHCAMSEQCLGSASVSVTVCVLWQLLWCRAAAA